MRTRLLSRSEPKPTREALHDERQLSLTLQRMIQPSRVEQYDIRGLCVSARCLSADSAEGIGGDWYLTVPLPNGDVVMAVGDVTGHGLAAAAAMTPMRYAMAAFIAEGAAPTVVLGRLNSFLVDSGMTATAVVVRYRPADGSLLWARAGHPPILLAHAGRVRIQPNPIGPLLGLRPGAYFEHARTSLPVGAHLVCYTDGMIGRGLIDDGIETLAGQVRRALATSQPVLEQLDYTSAADDACVLMAQRLIGQRSA